MSKFVGRRGTIGIAKESSRGVGTLTNVIWLPWATVSFDDKIEGAVESQALGKRAAQDSFYVTQKMAEGNVEAELYDKALGLILASLFGAAPSTTGSNPYTHTYTLSQTNQSQSLSILYQDPDTAKLFTLGVVDGLKMTIEQNALVKWEISFKSRQADDFTLQTASFTSLGSKFLHQHLAFKTASSIAGIAAATPLNLKKLELNIKNNAMFDTEIGTVEPADVLSQEFSVEGAVELLKVDETYRNAMNAGTYFAVEVKLNGGTSQILTLQMPRVYFNEWEQDRKLNEIVGQKFNFTANYDSANAADIISTATLVNTQVSY